MSMKSNYIFSDGRGETFQKDLRTTLKCKKNEQVTGGHSPRFPSFLVLIEKNHHRSGMKTKKIGKKIKKSNSN